MSSFFSRGALIAALALTPCVTPLLAQEQHPQGCTGCDHDKPVAPVTEPKPVAAVTPPKPVVPAVRAGAEEGCQCPDCLKDRAEAPADTLRFSVESAVARALEANRDLKAAAYTVEEAQGRLDGAGLYPNPEVELGAAPGVTPKSAYRFSVGVTQRFPVTDRLKLAREVSATEVAAAREEVNAVRRDLIGEIKTEAIEVLAWDAELRLLDARITLATEAAKAARKRAGEGAESPLDAAYAELALADAKTEKIRVEAAKVTTLNGLKTRLGLAPNAAIEITGELPDPGASPGTRPALAAEDCPDYRRGKILAEGAETSVRLAEARRWGDVGVGLYGEMERETARAGGSDSAAGFIGVKVSIPLPLWDDNRGEVRSAKARRERLHAELAAENLRTEGASSTAWKEYAQLCEAMRPLRTELLPAARALTERVKASSQHGEIGFVEVIRAREKEADLEKRLVTLRRDAELAHIRWETASAAHPALKAPADTGRDNR